MAEPHQALRQSRQQSLMQVAPVQAAGDRTSVATFETLCTDTCRLTPCALFLCSLRLTGDSPNDRHGEQWYKCLAGTTNGPVSPARQIKQMQGQTLG